MQPMQPGAAAPQKSNVLMILVIVGVVFIVIGGGVFLTLFGAGFASYKLQRAKAGASATATTATTVTTAPSAP